MAISLYEHQSKALQKMKNGCILCGGVGSGKSRTGLAYYFTQNGGVIDKDSSLMTNPQDLYIITTARKRDTHEWEGEIFHFGLTLGENTGLYQHKVVIDSWNNIKKYVAVKDAFFIFDEDRVTGSGTWAKTFIKIAKNNKWIVLSATPGDTWSDYIPVFVANGFYKNRTEFLNEHAIYNRMYTYKIDSYVGTGRLMKYRNDILVDMVDFVRSTTPHHEKIFVDYDISKYKDLVRYRWNEEEEKPIENPAEFCFLLRKIVNSDESRIKRVIEIVKERKKVIIFYNYNFELDILREHLERVNGLEIAEWNGHKHQKLPEGDYWVYLVHFLAGAEGWNCITTDSMIFFSQNYSYKCMIQAQGRIDRLNTPYKDLYYYHLKSHAPIDLAISRALNSKKEFNERRFIDRV